MVKRKRVDAWVDQVSEAPRAGLPDERGITRARWQRRYVTFATYALVPSLLLAVFAVFGTQDAQGQVEPGGTAVSAEDPLTVQSRAVATQAVRDWLASDPSPLPDGRVLSWNFARDVSPIGTGEGEDAGEDEPIQRLLAHEFTLTDGRVTFASQVTTVVDPALGVQIVGSPSLLPYAPSAPQLQADGPWPGTVEAAATSSVEEAVRQWAKTFTGEDPAALRLVTGDPDASHSYMPLMGVSLLDSEIDTVSVPASLLDEEGRAPTNPATVIARVKLMFTWGDPPVEGDPAAAVQPVSYDLLIRRADTASPQVVAWGGPGSGPDLKPYANAVTGRTLITPGDDEDGQGEQQDGDQEGEDSPAPEEPAGQEEDQ